MPGSVFISPAAYHAEALTSAASPCFELVIMSPASPLISFLPLAVALIGIPRIPPFLLSLLLDCRTALLGRSMDRGWPLYVFAAPALRLRACYARSDLLARR